MKPISENEKQAFDRVKSILKEHSLCFDRLEILALALDRDYDPDWSRSVSAEEWVELFSDDPKLMQEELKYSRYRSNAAKKSIQHEEELTRLINNKLEDTNGTR